MANTDVLPDAGEADLPDAGEADLTERCRGYLSVHRAKLSRAMDDRQRGIDVAAGYARMFDGLFRMLFDVAVQPGGTGGAAGPRVALVAVGGYGRGLVAPHSDVDVVFLCEDPADPFVLGLAEAMLYPLWDCGVDVGHAVRSLEESIELSREDIRTATTLLDMRHVAGDGALTADLAQRGQAQVIDGERDVFISALITDMERRHERYGGTLYLREPEIKSGRGGLRDLDVVTWVGRARWGVADLEGLVSAGGIDENEWLDLRDARDHLWSTRNQLHALAGRRQDRLTFEDQEVVARRLGYRDGVTLGVEQFMQVHYCHARVIARLADAIGERARRVPHVPSQVREIGTGIMVHDGFIVMDEGGLRDDPHMALRLYQAVQRERLPPAPRSRDAIAGVAHDREWCQRLRRDPACSGVFLELLAEAERSPVRNGSVLSELHDLGLLVALVPEFEPVIGRAPHDAYHAYTAEVQAIKAVNYLKALVRGEHATQYHDVSRAAAEMPRPLPLYLALLLHSIGASHPDDPAGYAAAVAGHVARRLGLDASIVRHAQWLIGMQDAFYNWSTRRDINDPEIIADVAGEIQTIYRLRDLYLFTFANVATANPNAMNAWNARMFMDLWHAAQNYLEGREDDIVPRMTEDVQQGVVDPKERAALQRFLTEMPVRYMHANTAAGIRFHCRAGARPDGRPAVAVDPSGVSDDAVELLVVVDDRRGVLAELAAALVGFRFELDSAQLYTRIYADGRREAFDLFHLRGISAHDRAELDRLVDTLRARIEDLLAGRTTTERLLDSRPPGPTWVRNGPRIKTEIRVDNRASSRYTVIDVYTRARDIVLYTIARELNKAGLSIAFAKVNTEGDRVADVFYVLTETREKLEDQERVKALCAQLRRALQDIDRTR